MRCLNLAIMLFLCLQPLSADEFTVNLAAEVAPSAPAVISLVNDAGEASTTIAPNVPVNIQVLGTPPLDLSLSVEEQF